MSIALLSLTVSKSDRRVIARPGRVTSRGVRTGSSGVGGHRFVLECSAPREGCFGIQLVWRLIGVAVGSSLFFMVMGGGDPLCFDSDIGILGFFDGFGT